MEIGGRGIILQIPREGVRQLAAGGIFAGQQLRDSDAALHAALISQQNGRNSIVGIKPRNIGHTAYVQHNRNLVERGADLLHHCLLRIGQVIVPLRENPLRAFGKRHLVLPRIVLIDVTDLRAVPSLAGKAADNDHRHIGFLTRRGQQALGKLRLCHHAGDIPRCIALRNVIAIIIRQRLVNRHILQLQPIVHAAGIGHGHIAASAAAFHIVKASLAEQRHAAPGRQRKQPAVIFQQYHPFPCGLPGKRDMGGAGGHVTILMQRQIGLAERPNPFFHTN